MLYPRHDPNHEAVSIRFATTEDEPSLELLAELDSAEPPGGRVLIAEVGGSPLAALGMADGKTIANPFRPTADVVSLLRLRAYQLRPEAASRAGRWRLVRVAAASRQTVRDTRDRLHRLLKGADVPVEHLHRG